MGKPLKPWPDLKTDDEVDHFVQNNDLSEYDTFPNPMKMGDFLDQLEARNKDRRINMRIGGDMLERLKAEAEKLDIPYQRLIRMVLNDWLLTRR